MGFTYRAAGPITAVVVLTVLCGCSRTQRDWRAAQQADTAQAYQAFVQRHPQSELAAVARRRAAQLTEQAAWQQATRANTAAAYRDYLASYPNGSWSQDARIRMESLSLAQPPQGAAAVAPAAGQPAAAAAAGSNPEGQAASGSSAAGAASPGPAMSLESDGGAVQLGAFSSAANAHRQWQQLAARFRSQLAGLTPRIVPVTLSGRRLYRLEAGVAGRSAAVRLCRELQQHSQGCLPLP